MTKTEKIVVVLLLSVIVVLTCFRMMKNAEAAVISPLSCSEGIFGPSADNCLGSYDLGRGENDVTNGGSNDVVTKLLNEDLVFGAGEWMFFDKQDTTFGVDLFTIDNIDQTSGTITFNVDLINALFGGDFLNDYDLVISLKAGNSFSLYQWDGALRTNVFEWSTDGVSVNHNDVAQQLSHGSAYGRINEVEVHESSILFLFMTGVFGLYAVMLSRLKK